MKTELTEKILLLYQTAWQTYNNLFMLNMQRKDFYETIFHKHFWDDGIQYQFLAFQKFAKRFQEIEHQIRCAQSFEDVKYVQLELSSLCACTDFFFSCIYAYMPTVFRNRNKPFQELLKEVLDEIKLLEEAP